MEARIVIDLGTATPPYEQVQTQIASLIAVGELQPGTRLPTIRSLAGDLGVAAGTVARAYKELEAAGHVASNRRQGTVVAGRRSPAAPSSPSKTPDTAQPSPPPPQKNIIKLSPVNNALEVMAAVDHLLDAGDQAGLDGKTLMSLVQGRFNQRTVRLTHPLDLHGDYRDPV